MTTLPHDAEAELFLLSDLWRDPSEADKVRGLPGDALFIVKHRMMLDAMLCQIDRGDFTFSGVCRELEARGQLAEIGGERFLLDLQDAISIVPLDRAIDRVAKAWQARNLITGAGDMVKLAYAGQVNEAKTALNSMYAKFSGNGHSTAEPLCSSWAVLDSLISPITWTWKRWLANGLLTIVASEPGTGKSALCLRLAACFIRGDSLPDGTPYTGERGAVLWCEAEAAQAVNLERARAWDLPLDLLLTPLDDPLADVHLDDPDHQKAVSNLAHHQDVRLVVVDSLRGAHQGDENSSEMAGAIKWLAEVARDTGKPVILTHHLRKRNLFDGDSIALDRLRGSSAIVQTARLVWALDVPDLGQPDRKRLAVIKSNLARFPEPIGITINETGVTFMDAPEPPKHETTTDKAADLLRDLLASGPMPADKIRQEFDGAGISWQAGNRAKQALGIISVKPGGYMALGITRPYPLIVIS